MWLTSCTKETVEFIGDSNTNTAELNGKITYNFNGTTYTNTGKFIWEKRGTVMIAIAEGDNILRVYVYDTVPGNYSVGSYQGEPGTAFITYFEDKTNQVEPYKSTEGSVTLSIANDKASGNFEGNLFRAAGAKNAKVTAGAFSRIQIK